MNQKTLEILDFYKIREMLAEHTLSNLGRNLALSLKPSPYIAAVSGMLQETTEAKLILEASGSPPFYGLADLTELIGNAKSGGVLDPGQLIQIGDFLRGCRKTKEFMTKRISLAPRVAGYALGLTVFEELEQEINRCLINGIVDSDASSALKKIRREITKIQEKIRTKLEQLILAPDSREWLQESVVAFKENRPVLMVKASAKSRLPGVVLGSSGSGNTLFVEPLAVHNLSNELRELEGAEQAEIYQILAALSAEVSLRVSEIEANQEIMAQYDFTFAKARLSRAMDAVAPKINGLNRIKLYGARHPLLNQSPVPLDFYIGTDYRTLVITGPNTGGKTVALKTIGLLSLMAQAGLHIPARPESEVAVFDDVLADIGDGQNLRESLSTFSAHLTNIIEIMAHSRRTSLVLIDEIGTGTDPGEGAALAIAILEYLHEQGGITVATTHYPEIKHYAIGNPGFLNGSMTFDRQNLKPLYQLVIGEPGESNALWIAEKLGMNTKVLKRARVFLKPGEFKQETMVLPLERQIPAQQSLPAEPVSKQTGIQQAPDKIGEPVTTVKVGDLVEIPFLGEKGVVCSAPDEKGRIRVMIKDKKLDLQVKRVKLLIPAEKLYPDDYDLNIVLLSKEDRKLKKMLGKHHQPGVSRVIKPEEV